jgi:hypothetical protein
MARLIDEELIRRYFAADATLKLMVPKQFAKILSDKPSGWFLTAARFKRR